MADIAKAVAALEQGVITAQRLLDLMRHIQSGKVESEDLPVALRTKFVTRAKTMYASLKTNMADLEANL